MFPAEEVQLPVLYALVVHVSSSFSRKLKSKKHENYLTPKSPRPRNQGRINSRSPSITVTINILYVDSDVVMETPPDTRNRKESFSLRIHLRLLLFSSDALVLQKITSRGSRSLTTNCSLDATGAKVFPCAIGGNRRNKQKPRNCCSRISPSLFES